MYKLKLNKRKASMTIEFAYGIFAALVVMFIALGVVCNSMSQIASKSNIQNMFKSNTKSTAYEASLNTTKTTVNDPSIEVGGSLGNQTPGGHDIVTPPQH